jgi:hypothetical protein
MILSNESRSIDCFNGRCYETEAEGANLSSSALAHCSNWSGFIRKRAGFLYPLAVAPRLKMTEELGSDLVLQPGNGAVFVADHAFDARQAAASLS